jgi:hypothetical protein
MKWQEHEADLGVVLRLIIMITGNCRVVSGFLNVSLKYFVS